VTRRNEGIIALLMVLALIAFVIGSAIGITVSIEQHENATDNNTTHVENVTSEMTNKNPNDDGVDFDYEKDSVDYNDNYTREMYNITY
jgi:hypothetical protein